MLQEQDLTYTVAVDSTMVSEAGLIKPDAYQKLLLYIQHRHREQFGHDIPTMVRNHGLTWVLLSTTVDIHGSLKLGEALTARTWSTGRDGIIFRQEVAFYREDGSLVLTAAKFYGIMDLQNRKLCKAPAMLDRFSLPEGERLLQAQSRCTIDTRELPEIGTTAVRPSWLDVLGHVNNTRYGEMAYDALEEAGLAQKQPYSRIEYYFTGELRKGDHALLRAKQTDRQTIVIGTRLRDGRQSFLIRLYI